MPLIWGKVALKSSPPWPMTIGVLGTPMFRSSSIVLWYGSGFTCSVDDITALSSLRWRRIYLFYWFYYFYAKMLLEDRCKPRIVLRGSFLCLALRPRRYDSVHLIVILYLNQSGGPGARNALLGPLISSAELYKTVAINIFHGSFAWK